MNLTLSVVVVYVAFTAFMADPSLAAEDATDQEMEGFYDIMLKVGSPQEVVIQRGKPTRLILQRTRPSSENNVTKDFAFYVFEVHTHAVGVRFSDTPFVNGSNTTSHVKVDHGLVVKNHPEEERYYAYIENTRDQGDIRGLVLVRGYSDKAPVPGLGSDRYVRLV